MNRQIDFPDFDVPIRKWWNGIYDYIFIVPYPFHRIPSVSRSNSSAKDYYDPFEFDELPDDLDEITKQRGEPITWHEIHQSIAPEVPKMHFYNAVRLAVFGFRNIGDISLQKKIRAYCAENKIFLPDEDGLPPILHEPLMQFLTNFKQSKIVAWDEFREHSCELPLEELAPDRPMFYLPESSTSPCLWAVHIKEPGVLIASQFDGTETLIAMTETALNIADPQDYFEIEQVNDTTYSDRLYPIDFIE